MHHRVSSTLLTALAICLATFPHPSEAGILTGKISNPSAVGVANVQLDFFENANGNPVAVAGNITDALGNYAVSVPDGTYDIEVVTPVVSGGVVPTFLEAVVIAGTVPLNLTLPFGLVVTGTVVDTLGQPVELVDLNSVDALTGVLEFTPNDNTDILGVYEVILTPGLKDLRFAPVAGSRLAAVTWESISLATDTTIDIALPAGFFVTGTVRGPGAVPVQDADMDFDDSFTGKRHPTPADNTDNNGFYSVTVADGVYDITVEPLPGDMLAAARKFAVPIHRDTVVDFDLVGGFNLSGTVTGPSGVVFNCDIDVFDTLTGIKLATPGDKTDAGGFYNIIVPVGIFDLRFQPPVSTGLASTLVPAVHIGQDTVVNATVQAGKVIQGVVRNPSFAGVPDVDIDIFDATTGATILTAGDKTSALGHYAMVLLPGFYDLEFEPPKARRLTATRFYGINVTNAASLAVTLDTGSAVSGVVTASGLPVDSVNVDAIRISDGGDVFLPQDQTSATGAYEIVIKQESHDLVFNPPVSSGLAATLIPGVTPTSDIVVNAALSPGVHLSGTVDGPGGVPVSGVLLRAEAAGNWVPTADGTSDAAGAYETIIPTGTYDLTFQPPSGSGMDPMTLTGVVISGDAVVDATLSAQTCSCSCHADPQCDGFSNVLDVVKTVNVAFKGAQPESDAGCPRYRTDVDCSGQTNVLDVVKIVAVAFKGALPVDMFCSPCGP